MGSNDRIIILKITISKLFLTQGRLPKKYPASVKLNIQRKAPITLNKNLE